MLPRLSTTHKLTIILALLSSAPLVVIAYHRSGESLDQLGQYRARLCEQVALGCSVLVRENNYRVVEQWLDQYHRSSPAIEGVRLVRFDGLVIFESGANPDLWKRNYDQSSAFVETPIVRAGRVWGTIQTLFSERTETLQTAYLLRAFGVILLINGLTFGLLLRRTLSVLDSSKAVPRRVRNTLDTIAGGVVILDGQERVLMSNSAFQQSTHTQPDELLGRNLGNIPFASDSEEMPWKSAIRCKQQVSGVTLFLKTENETRFFVANATPIFDGKDEIAGTLVSFEDVTALEQQKQSLMLALKDLEQSREQIHQQNLKLQDLANKDVLTGCINRRALFEILERSWTEFQTDGQNLNCIMFDVDHFKKLNDTHGHAVGDQVLRDVARTIREAVGSVGTVGRYGGEEFCVILTGMPVTDAMQVGESVRSAIETELISPYHVTASLGCSGTEMGAVSFQAVLEQADAALYAAKHGGRNAIRCWSPDLEKGQSEGNAKKKPASIPKAATSNVSYHAVASLHAALAYRDADTALHSQRVAELSVSLGRGLMSVSELYVLEVAALLHDIGKIGVPDSILLKPGRLDKEEWKIMETHARIGVEIVEASLNSKLLSEIIRFHHYRFDGTNTPEGGPIGEDIPLGARIVCIVDAYDAMVSDRVYRPGRPPEEAFAELRRCAGSQFDPELVDRFVHLQIGWRPDSRLFEESIDEKQAIAVGHLTERTLASFESHDESSLRDSLKQLGEVGLQFDLPILNNITAGIQKAITESRDGSWDEALPMLQDLLEMCLTVQRAHIRELANKPLLTEGSEQSNVLTQLRSIGKANQM